jgi:nucleotide-binding universal stress UspA family protein
MIDSLVVVDIVVPQTSAISQKRIAQDTMQASRWKRELKVFTVNGEPGPDIVRIAEEGQYDLVIAASDRTSPAWLDYLLNHAHCPVYIAFPPAVLREVVES